MKKYILPLICVLCGMALMGYSFVKKPHLDADDIVVHIEKADFIMPAAHRVYANPEAADGKYYLFKTKITNTTSATLEDVTVKYRIPNYIDWTELAVSGEMFPGQTIVVPCYPKFNADITEKTTESVEKAEIEISWDGAREDDVIEEDFSFRLTNRNEFVYTGIKAEEISTWSDMYDNDDLIACFVTPNDPIVKYYTQNIQEKILQGESASVHQSPKQAVRFMQGIYEATLRSHMVYSGTKGIPKSTDDVQSIVQQVRLPREVITGNTGLCIELSALYASILSAAGIDPVIYMVPGHAYPGFKMQGQYFAIEATAIGGEGLGGIAPFKKALEVGQGQLDTLLQFVRMGDPRYKIIDIHEVNARGVTAMDLKDNDFMRNKVDDIVASWQNNQPSYARRRSRDAGGQRQPTSSPASTTYATRGLSFTIPAGWQTIMRPSPQIPMATAQVISPDQMITATVYDLPTNSLQQGMAALTQNLNQLGLNVQYQFNGHSVSGSTSDGYQVFNWVGKAIPNNGGLRIVTVGAPAQVYQQSSAIIQQVYNSIK